MDARRVPVDWSALSDSELVHQVLGEDHGMGSAYNKSSATAELTQRVDKAVRQALSRYTLPVQVREDLHQEAWVRLWRTLRLWLENCERNSETGRIAPYVRKIASNLVIDHFRHAKWEEVAREEVPKKAIKAGDTVIEDQGEACSPAPLCNRDAVGRAIRAWGGEIMTLRKQKRLNSAETRRLTDLAAVINLAYYIVFQDHTVRRICEGTFDDLDREARRRAIQKKYKLYDTRRRPDGSPNPRAAGHLLLRYLSEQRLV